MSDTLYLEKWSRYAKQPIKWEDQTPRKFDDTRKRVRRETLRGKTTFFHTSIEDYLVRQFNAHTTTRVFLNWLLSVMLTYKSKVNIKFRFQNILLVLL